MTAPLLFAAISAVIFVEVVIGMGIAFWRLQYREATDPLTINSEDVATATTGAWAGWREFRVESDAFEDCGTDLALADLHADGWSAATGLRAWTIPDILARSPRHRRQSRSGRSYAAIPLSDQPNAKTYRITVKRMPAPSTLPASRRRGV